MKSKRILSILLTLCMVFSLVPMSVFAEDTESNVSPAADAVISVTVSNQGVLAKDNDGKAMANREVTVKDIEPYDGVLTVNEALIATHKTYNAEAGYMSADNDYGGLGVNKLWNKDTFNTLFFVNGAGLSTDVGSATIKSGDKLLASINQDNNYSADWYTYFTETEKSVETNSSFTLTLKGFLGMAYLPEDLEPTVLPGISVGTWENGELSEIGTTDTDGKVSISFTEAGTYIVTATGTVKDDVVINWGTYETEEKDCPIIAPFCIVSVTEPESSAMSDKDAVNTIYTEFSTKANNYTSSTNTPLIFPLEYEGVTYTNVIAYMKAWGKKNTGRDIEISYNGNTASTTGYADFTSGSQTKYIPVAFDETTEITQNYYKDNAPLSQRIGNIIFSVGEVKSEEMKTGIYAKVSSLERTPEEIADFIAKNFPFERINGKNESADYIVSPLGTGTTTLSLPTKDELYTDKSAKITWSLVPETDGDTALVLNSNKITVTRPNVGEENAKFTLKAEIVSVADANVKKTVEFPLTVPAFEEVIVPVMVTEGAALSVSDGVYKTDVEEKYIVKQAEAPEGYDLYHLSLHSGVTGTNATFTCIITKDGYITKTQKLTVGTTAPTEATVIDLTQSSENDTKLASLEILTPSVSDFTFAPDTYTYNIEVAGGEFVKLAGIPFVPEATAKITSYYSSLKNANSGTLTTTGKPLTSSGVNCYLPDEPGVSTVEITVTAPDGSIQETKTQKYILNITKTGKNAPLTKLVLKSSSSDAGTKNNIDISGISPEEVLTPTFTSGAKEDVYYYTVNYFRDKLTITPTAAGCTITENGKEVVSGKASEEIDLAVGDNEIKIVVSDEANDTEYKIIVHRKAELVITDVTLDSGSLNTVLATDGSNWTANSSFAYDAEKVNVTYHTNITEKVTIKVAAGDKTYVGTPGEPIEIDVSGEDKIMPYVSIIHNNNGVLEAQTYVISLNRSASTYPSSVESYLPAPGQFVNVASYMAPGKVISGSGMITLGAFGGNVVYKYDEPIANSENNPYGIDFIIAGNAFADADGGTSSGSAEPAAVMVSKDGVNWYELAGSEYYSADTERNLTITYTNPDITFEKAVDVPYIFSNGDSGSVLANDYHKQAYYPNPSDYNIYQSGVGKNNTYTAESVTFDGTRINSGFYPFGYADSHTYVGGNTAENPYAENHKYTYNGDGFDISWAVDADGNSVELDEISYIKIYNPLMHDGGSTGEKSAEISKITKVQSNPSAVGTSKGLSKLAVNGKEITLQSDVYEYTIDAEGASTLEITPETENADANIYVSNKRVKSGDSAKLTAVSKLRVIVQEGQCEPVIYMLSFTNAQTPEANADLSSLTLTPGDVTKTPDNENAVSFDVDSSVASIRFKPTTAGKGASVSISGGSITEAITLENGEQSSAISISKGKNEFTVTVTSKDLANTKTYIVTVNRMAGTSSSEQDSTIRVKFSLVGDKVHYDKDKEEYTGTHSSQTWISQTSVTIPKGSTVKYLTEMMLNNAGIDYETDGIYISEIKGLAEFDNGPNSGWMYRHNGTIADEGYAARKLESGDVIKWFYTDDYTKETGYEGSWDNVNTGGSGSTIKKDETTTENTTIAKTETTVSGTTATVTTSEQNITNAITEAKKDNASEIVIASRDTKNADTIKLEIPANSVKEIAESKDLTLSVETSAGDVAISNETLNAIVEQSGNADSLNVVVETKTADETIKNTENITEVVSKDVLENATIVEVTITSGNTSIRTFGGHKLSVDVPVDGKNHEKGKIYKVHIISADGSIETTYGECVEKNGKLSVKVQTKHLSSFVVTDIETAPFTDIPDHWAYEAIKYAYNNSIMQGVDEGIFAPDDTMTRAMLVTVLYRLENEPAINKSIPFADVESGQWYANAVIWAQQNGIVSGVSETEFAPNADITREQMAAILYRYAQYKKQDTSVGEDTNILSYDDAFDISEYAYSAIQWMVGAGLMKGETESTINPQGNCTRAQVATILMRYLEM